MALGALILADVLNRVDTVVLLKIKQIICCYQICIKLHNRKRRFIKLYRQGGECVFHYQVP